MKYQTKGVCARAIDLEIENGVITKCVFDGGCRGNTQGLSRMVIGRPAQEVMTTLRGVECRGNTSCPDQLSHAIEKYLSEQAQ